MSVLEFRSTKPSVAEVLRAIQGDKRYLDAWISQFADLVEMLEAGEALSIDRLANRTGNTRAAARKNLLRYERGGYVQRERFVGPRPDAYTLSLPTPEQRSLSLKRADLWLTEEPRLTRKGEMSIAEHRRLGRRIGAPSKGTDALAILRRSIGKPRKLLP